jgi:DNA-directed RNA polymerase subunit RPC12/RpoP
MKISKRNSYKCDRCGSFKSREETASLSTYYQPIGLVGYKEGNLGVRHLCSKCKNEFEEYFEGFFTSLNRIINNK